MAAASFEDDVICCWFPPCAAEGRENPPAAPTGGRFVPGCGKRRRRINHFPAVHDARPSVGTETQRERRLTDVDRHEDKKKKMLF